MKKLIVLVALMMSVGCGNMLVLTVDGQKFKQQLPEKVAFPIVVEILDEEEAAEEEAAIKAAEEAARKAAEEAETEEAVEAEKPQAFKYIVRRGDRVLRIKSATESSRYARSSGMLASTMWWFW
jgi:ABC-type Na+ efflux pump permease subunit